ncbi:SAF domain-containing protein [Arcanobacterium phocae]|uniref:SAF domain-containing protein n=1 Tax=Arcanobacterium phocae TaxID=131112 RepID=UPI001C0EAC3E|nr:SAF domain-containing protein [Arcanobacterium phocae]
MTTVVRPQRVRAKMWQWRWVGFFALCAVIIQQILALVVASQPAEYQIVAARTSLPAGYELTNDDIELIPVHAVLPGMSTDAEEIVGHHLLVPVNTGEAIGTNQVLSPHTIEQAAPGFVIAPVSLADTGGLAMLHTGNYVDLFAPAPDSFSENPQDAQLVARHIRVAGIAQNSGEQSFLHNVPDTMNFFLEIPDSTIKVVLGTGSRAPLIAVLSGASQ